MKVGDGIPSPAICRQREHTRTYGDIRGHTGAQRNKNENETKGNEVTAKTTGVIRECMREDTG